MLDETRTGAITAAPGTTNTGRSEKTGASVVSQGHGSYVEAVMQGNVYGVCSQAGVTTQAGLSLTTPTLTLDNPAGSGKNLSIWYVGVTYSVIFAAIAAVWVAVGTNTVAAAITAGTLTVTHRNMKLGLANDCVGIPRLATTLPAIPVGISLLGTGLTGAVALFPTIKPLGRWFDGSLILKPGTNLTVQTSAASGAAGQWCEFIWEEVDE